MLIIHDWVNLPCGLFAVPCILLHCHVLIASQGHVQVHMLHNIHVHVHCSLWMYIFSLRVCTCTCTTIPLSSVVNVFTWDPDILYAWSWHVYSLLVQCVCAFWVPLGVEWCAVYIYTTLHVTLHTCGFLHVHSICSRLCLLCVCCVHVCVCMYTSCTCTF